jgi:hypothetical protein
MWFLMKKIVIFWDMYEMILPFWHTIFGLAYQGKDIVFSFIIE